MSQSPTLLNKVADVSIRSYLPRLPGDNTIPSSSGVLQYQEPAVPRPAAAIYRFRGIGRRRLLVHGLRDARVCISFGTGAHGCVPRGEMGWDVHVLPQVIYLVLGCKSFYATSLAGVGSGLFQTSLHYIPWVSGGRFGKREGRIHRTVKFGPRFTQIDTLPASTRVWFCP